MTNVLLPIAGLAKRFLDQGYNLPKPLIPVNGVPMIRRATESLLEGAGPYRLIFIVRADHCASHNLADTLRHLYRGWDLEIVVTDQVTQGALCSCLLARAAIEPQEPLVIFTPDVCFAREHDALYDFVRSQQAGLLLTFKANSPDHSYVAFDALGRAQRVAEKVVISNDALVGVYGFRSGELFLRYADEAIRSDLRSWGEFYIAPVYNLLIRDGLAVGVRRLEKMHVLGTPADLNFYERHVARFDVAARFALCCDHSGFALKEALCAVLAELDVDYTDFGTYSNKDSDHYDALRPCVEFLRTTTNTFGLGICSTGQGFNIAANKAAGIRSALVQDATTAALARRHNAANFFCLPSQTVSAAQLPDLVRAIVTNTFDGGRHATRIQKVAADPLFIE